MASHAATASATDLAELLAKVIALHDSDTYPYFSVLLAKVIVPQAANAEVVAKLAEPLAQLLEDDLSKSSGKFDPSDRFPPPLPADVLWALEEKIGMPLSKASDPSAADLAELLAKVIALHAAASASASDFSELLAKVIVPQAANAGAVAMLAKRLAQLLEDDLSKSSPKFDPSDRRDGEKMGIPNSKASDPFAGFSVYDDPSAHQSPSPVIGRTYLEQVTAPRPTSAGRLVRGTTSVPSSIRFTHDVGQPKVKDVGDQPEASARQDQGLDQRKRR